MKAPIFDERYTTADDAIKESLFLLMKEKSIDKITVSDVIKRAGVVRSTFYKHFENIPDLVTALEDQTIRDIFSIIDAFHPDNDISMCQSYFMTLCDYTMNNPFLIELLRSPRGDQFLEKAITMFHTYVSRVTEQKTASKEEKEYFSFVVACSIGSTIGVLHKWTTENFRTPKETVAHVLTESFVKGLLPLL